MSVPSQYLFDQNSGLNFQNISDPTGANVAPNDPSGQLTEADLIGGGQSGVGGFGTAPQLGPVNVGSLDMSSYDPSLNSNPGTAPTALDPSQLQPISMTGLSGLDSQLQQELGLNSPTPVSTPSSTFNFNGSNLLNDAALMGIGYYGMSQAKSAQAQTNKEIQPLMQESQTMLGESNNLLKEYQSGQLPPWAQSTFNQMNTEGTNLVNNYNAGKLPSAEQAAANSLNATASNLLKQYQSGQLPGYAKQFVDWTSQQATDLIKASPTQALETLAAQSFTDYTSGKLKPGDQVALDQSVAAQKQRVASLLASSGDTDSSVLTAQFQQIDNQAQVTKQNILNSYFQTGDQAYNTWVNTNVQAAQIKAMGAQFANQVFTTMLSDALQTKEFAANYTAQGLEAQLQAGMQAQEYAATYKEKTFSDMLSGAFQGATIGDQALTQAIGIQLQSDNELSAMVGSLMQSLATSFAYSAYMNRNGSGNTGAASTSGGGNGIVSSLVGTAVNKIGGTLISDAANYLGFSSAGGGAAALPGGVSAAVGGAPTGAELGAGSEAVSAPISAAPAAASGAAGAAAGSDALSAAGVGESASGGFATGGASGAGASAAGTESLATLGAGVGVLAAASYLTSHFANRNSYITNAVNQLTSDPASGIKMNAAGTQAAHSSGGIAGTENYVSNAGSPGYTSPYDWNGKTFHGDLDQAANLWNAYKTGTGTLQAYQQYMQANSG